MKTKTKKSHVSKITIGRLFNCGNYENIKYEVTVDVTRGASAREVLLETASILACLKPTRAVFDLESKRALLKRDPSELTEFQKDQLPRIAEEVGEFDRRTQQRLEALKHLDEIGGVSKKRDAKADWTNDDVPF